MSGKQKQSTLGKFGFARSIQHCGEKVNREISEFVNKTGIPCHMCNKTFQTKQVLSSHMGFKHGKYANRSCDNPVSVIKKDTTSVSATTVLSEELTITTDADISSAAPSNFSVTTVSSFADSSTSIATDLTQGASISTTMIDLVSEEPKGKQSRIKHNA